MDNSTCPLCNSHETRHFHRDRQRDYRRCAQCWLVYVDSSQHLSPDAEKAIYDLHQNRSNDAGYLNFLSRLALPLTGLLPPGSEGLDYGCGPGPALAGLLEGYGHRVKLYDPFYANHRAHLQQQYDFVTCTEVIEHFREPGREFARLFGLIRPGGWLGIMTKLVIDADAFSRWHYKNDPTHIAFFSRPTLTGLAERYDCAIEFIGSDVIILQRNPHRRSR